MELGLASDAGRARGLKGGGAAAPGVGQGGPCGAGDTLGTLWGHSGDTLGVHSPGKMAPHHKHSRAILPLPLKSSPGQGWSPSCDVWG